MSSFLNRYVVLMFVATFMLAGCGDKTKDSGSALPDSSNADSQQTGIVPPSGDDVTPQADSDLSSESGDTARVEVATRGTPVKMLIEKAGEIIKYDVAGEWTVEDEQRKTEKTLKAENDARHREEVAKTDAEFEKQIEENSPAHKSFLMEALYQGLDHPLGIEKHYSARENSEKYIGEPIEPIGKALGEAEVERDREGLEDNYIRHKAIKQFEKPDFEFLTLISLDDLVFGKTYRGVYRSEGDSSFHNIDIDFTRSSDSVARMEIFFPDSPDSFVELESDEDLRMNIEATVYASVSHIFYIKSLNGALVLDNVQEWTELYHGTADRDVTVKRGSLVDMGLSFYKDGNGKHYLKGRLGGVYGYDFIVFLESLENKDYMVIDPLEALQNAKTAALE